MTTPRQALINLAHALVDDILAMSDEDILEEFREDGGDPEQHAAAMRALVEQAVGPPVGQGAKGEQT